MYSKVIAFGLLNMRGRKTSPFLVEFFYRNTIQKAAIKNIKN